MRNIKRMVIRMTAFFLVSGMMQWHTVYAAASQMQPADPAAVSENGENSAGQEGQETSGTDGQSGSSSDQDTGGTSDQDLGEASDQNSDVQGSDSSDIGDGDQQTDSTDSNSDGQESGGSLSGDDETDDNQGDGDEEWTGGEDDDEWTDDDDFADGDDDEWTDSWSGGDDDIDDGKWADDKTKKDKAKKEKAETDIGGLDEDRSGESDINSVDGIDFNADGKESYASAGAASDLYADGGYESEGLDQNYQTGAGLGNDIFLILAVACGTFAVGFTVRKYARRN